MSGAPLLSYVEVLHLLDDLPLIVREKRRREGLSRRAAGAACGVGDSALAELEEGKLDVPLRVVRAALRWVAT